MNSKRTTSALVCSLIVFATHAYAANAPVWLQQAAGLPDRGSQARATVLIDELNVVVGTDWKAKTIRHYAVRIHDLDGRDAAAMRAVYVSGTGSVRSIRGWLVRRTGDVRELGSANVVDAALVGNDVYNDVRVRALSASDEVAAGDVFGAEVETEERLLFAQFEWPLQNRWPVVAARRVLTLPERWHARAVTFNATPVAEHAAGQTLTWEIANLADIPDESAMPPASSLVPRLVVSIFADTRTPSDGQFDTWSDVSRWLDAISRDPSPSATIGEKARALTASARTELERITAIADYVQHVQYVSIQTGVGRGGGYQPRPPTLVLERNYGDCKDKASLMRALLAAAGMKAYLVAIYSGDRNYVREEWPSPQQFNHAIVAIAIQQETPSPLAFSHPLLGRLLLFDPTDEYTPVGELPIDEQGSLALVVSPQTDALTRVPSLPAAMNRLDRSLNASVTSDGGLRGQMHEESRGARGSRERGIARAVDPSTYRGLLERRLASSTPGLVVSNVVAQSATNASSFVVDFEVAVPRFAQQMGSLLLVKLPLGLDDPSYGLATARRTAVVVESVRTSDSIHLRLPSGVVVDEAPESVTFEAPFGSYSLKYTADADSITVQRVFELREQTIDAARQSELVAFLTRVHAADGAPLVLKK